MIKNITYKPIIKSYPEYAHLFSILGYPEDDINFSKWFCWNFIQLRYDTSDDVDEALFFEKDIEECSIYRCSLLDKLILEKKMIQTELFFREMVCQYLNDGFYILVVLGSFYFPFDKKYYNKQHLNHEVLIYGIDTEKQVYLIQDFFDNSYSSHEIFFADFWESYLNHYDYKVFDDEKIYLFKKKSIENIARLPFQMNKIQSLFYNYLVGEISRVDNRVYGIFCYDKIIERLKEGKVDFRDFCLLHEHFLASFLRIKLMSELNFIDLKRNSGIETSLKGVCDDTLVLRNALIKWTITNRLPLKDVENCLSEIKKKEIDIISQILLLISC